MLSIPKTHRYEKLKFKKCQYPNCELYFKGTGFSKYCLEHRQRKHRKVIDKANKKVVVTENQNQRYTHTLDSPEMITFECELCKTKFEIKVYPNIYIYPKYCDDHRNEHKRKMWALAHPDAAICKPAPIEEAEDQIQSMLELPDTASTVDPDTYLDYMDEDITIAETIEEGYREKRKI